MNKFSRNSQKHKESCCSAIQLVADRVLQIVDYSIICGHRGEKLQNKFFSEGKSKVKFPDGNHNLYPSLAIDIQPWPFDWVLVSKFYSNKTLNIKDRIKAIEYISKFHYLIGAWFGVANNFDLKFRWGGDFNQNLNFSDDKFRDLPHLELPLK